MDPTTTDLDAQLAAVLRLPDGCASRGDALDLRAWLVHADAALFQRSTEAVPRGVEETEPRASNPADRLTVWGQSALVRIMEATVQNRRGEFVAPVVEWLKGRALPTIVDYVGPPTPERELLLMLLSSFIDLCLGEDATAPPLPAPKRARLEDKAAEECASDSYTEKVGDDEEK